MPRARTSISRYVLAGMMLTVLLVAGAMTWLLIDQAYTQFDNQSEQLRQEYLQRERTRIRDEVTRVVEFIHAEQRQSRLEMRRSLKEHVDSAHAIATHLWGTFGNQVSREEAENVIRETLRPIRFNQGRGYFFAIRLDGTEMLFADRPEMEGKNLLDMQDTEDRMVIQDMIAIGQEKGEGFYEYTWTKPGAEGNHFRKLTFVKLFEPFGWVIGSGEYLDDFDASLQQRLLATLDAYESVQQGYIFAGHYDGTGLLGPHKGISNMELTDREGTKVVATLIDTARAGGGFVQYHMPGEVVPDARRKLSYVASIPEWEWYIGTGADMGQIESLIGGLREKLWREARASLLRLALLVVVLLALAGLTVHHIALRLRRATDRFQQFFEEAARSSTSMEPDEVPFAEFSRLAVAANAMIAAREQALGRLRESEQRFVQAQELAQVGSFHHDIVAGRLTWTDELRRIYGIGPEDAPLEGERHNAVIHPDDVGRVRANIQRARHTGELLRYEFRIRHADGGERILRVRGRWDYDEHGAPAVLAGAIQDVTTLRRTEQRYAQLFDSMLDGFALHEIILDDDGKPVDYRYLAVNPAFEKLTGLKSEDVINKTVREALPVSEAIWVDRYGQVALTGEPVRFEEYSADLERHYEVLAFRPGEGQFATVFKDVTERVEAAAKLAEREAMHRALFDESLNPILLVDTDGTYLDANRAALIFLESTREEVIGKHVWDFCPPDQIEEQRREHAPFDQRRTLETDYLISGRIKTLLLNVVPLRRGDQLIMCGIGLDVTERKAMEDELRQSEKMRAIGQLAGGVAHDFNNQLAAMHGYADLLARDLTDPDQREYAGYILQACQRSADLTRQLLAFARKGAYQRVAIDMHEVIDEVARLLRRSIDRRIEISLALEAEAMMVTGDPTQLQNALLNMGINARDSMPEGGELTFRTTNIDLDQAAAERLGIERGSGSFLMVEVADDGMGMAPEVMEKVFEPFFTTKGVGEGTGMGLAAVYGTATLHGGGVTVESEEGAGSTFRLYLPATAPRAEAPVTPDTVASESSETGDRTTEGVTVLLVEDEEMLRMMVTDMLTSLGYLVEVCADGVEGVERFQACGDRISLALVDLVMPRMDGLQTMAALKAIDPAIKVVFASGYGSSARVEQALASGAVGFVHKPFRLDELAGALRRALAGEPDRSG